MGHRSNANGGTEWGASAPADTGPSDGARDRAWFRAIYEHAALGIAAVDDAGRLVEANDALAAMLGRPAATLRGRTLIEIVEGAAETAAAEPLRDIVSAADARLTIDLPGTRGDGAPICLSLSLSRLASHDGDAVLVLASDVTERRRVEAELRHHAFHDALTGLANRVLFRERIEHALQRLSRGERVAMLLIDLDDFKTVNDSLGQRTGDELLRRLGDRLRGATRGHDTIARLGGDEFGVLFEGFASESDAQMIVDRIVRAIDAPLAIDGRTFAPSACFGLAHARLGESADELLRNADVAMHRAKAQGPGRTSEYEPSMHAEILERLALEEDLREAVERGSFHLTYQPIVELDDWRLVGLEALVRWSHDRRGIVSPAAFIPAAERTGLIVPLGRWILDETCRQLSAWRAAHPDVALPGISVNVSGRQLEDDGFVGEVARTLARWKVSPGSLTLEITESSILSRTSEMLERLLALKALGVRLAIDDFGTGYSSLSYLQRFPFDVLKVDKAFVDGVANGGSDAQLTRAIIALGKALRLRTVAEGIERPEQWAELRSLGCQVGQGFLFSRPLSGEAVGALLGEVSRNDDASVTLRAAR